MAEVVLSQNIGEKWPASPATTPLPISHRTVTPDIIDELEERLRRAMLAGDVEALDALIADSLLFVSHTGAVVTKEADLRIHRSRILRLIALEPSDRHVRFLGDSAVVSVRMHTVGENDGATFASTFRYLRVWAPVDGRHQIVAGQMTEVQG
jgi:ketosteroid isomerase-like protein